MTRNTERMTLADMINRIPDNQMDDLTVNLMDQLGFDELKEDGSIADRFVLGPRSLRRNVEITTDSAGRIDGETTARFVEEDIVL